MPTVRQNSLFIFAVFLLAACDKPAMFDAFAPINNGWHQDSIVNFSVPVQDTATQYYISLKLRHNADYPYENIYLFRTISSASGIEYQDTVDLKLADEKGKWLGEGVGEVKTMVWGFGRGGLRFKNTGKYTFTLQHGMRDSLLPGIMDVGLTINAIEEQAK